MARVRVTIDSNEGQQDWRLLGRSRPQAGTINIVLVNPEDRFETVRLQMATSGSVCLKINAAGEQSVEWKLNDFNSARRAYFWVGDRPVPIDRAENFERDVSDSRFSVRVGAGRTEDETSFTCTLAKAVRPQEWTTPAQRIDELLETINRQIFTSAGEQAMLRMAVDDGNRQIGHLANDCDSILRELRDLPQALAKGQEGAVHSRGEAVLVGDAIRSVQRIAECLPQRGDHIDHSPLARALRRLEELLDWDEARPLRAQVAELAGELQDADPWKSLAAAAENGDLGATLDSLHMLVADATRGDLGEHNLETRLFGFVRGLWTLERGQMEDGNSALRRAIDACLEQLELRLFVPNREAAYQPPLHRVTERRPAGPGEAIHRVVDVLNPGMERGAVVFEKAEVVISD